MLPRYRSRRGRRSGQPRDCRHGLPATMGALWGRSSVGQNAGLSRRRSRVRVPSLPSSKALLKRGFLILVVSSTCPSGSNRAANAAQCPFSGICTALDDQSRGSTTVEHGADDVTAIG